MSPQVLELAGGHKDIGHQHGEALKDEIHDCLDVYQTVIGKSFDQLADRAAHYEKVIASTSPNLLEELAAIAEASAVNRSHITLLNARSELMSVADGCTALFSPREKTLAQTWDWMQALEDRYVVLKITTDEGVQLATVTEPGMVGKIGLNDQGLGCTLNFLYSPGQHTGTPIHILLREVMQSRTLEEAKQKVAARQPGQTGNIMIGVSDGRGCNVELGGKIHSLQPLGQQPFVHTNHHLTNDIDPGELGEDSIARFERASELTSCETSFDVVRVLSDQNNPEHSICTPYKPL